MKKKIRMGTTVQSFKRAVVNVKKWLPAFKKDTVQRRNLFKARIVDFGKDETGKASHVVLLSNPLALIRLKIFGLHDPDWNQLG